MLAVALVEGAVRQRGRQDRGEQNANRRGALAPGIEISHGQGPVPIFPRVYVVASSLTVAF